MRFLRRSLLLIALLAVAGACGPARSGIELPTGDGVPLSEHAALWAGATEPCRAVRSMAFTLSIGGRANGAPLRRTRLRGAFEGGALRLEALAPFGAPIFILVAPDDQTATLLLPRDGQVVGDADPAALLDALAGLEMAPADVEALLTGCPAPEGVTVAGRRLSGGWIVIDLEGGVVAWLRDAPEGDGDPGLVVAAAQRGRLTVAYSDHVRGLPRGFRVEVEPPPAGPGGGRAFGAAGAAGATDLNASVTQVNINTALDPAVFQIDVPAAYAPITIDQLRGASPLEAPPGRDGSGAANAR